MNEPHATPRFPRKRQWLAALALALLASVTWLCWPARPVPPIRLEGLDPEVRSAIEKAQSRVRRFPKSGRIWGELGLLLYAHELSQDAQKCLLEASRLDSSDFRWPYLLGVIVEPVDRDSARRHFQTAVDRTASEPLPRIRLAELALDGHNLELAEHYLKEVQQIAANDPRVLFRLAQVQFLRGDNANCVPLAEQASRRAPGARGPLELLAAAHGRMQQTELARRFADAARQLPPGSDRWFDPVIQQANETRRDPIWFQFLAQKAQEQRDIPQAIQLLEPVWKHHKENPLLAEQLAKLWVAARNFDRSADILMQGLQHRPEAQNLWRTLGSVRLLQEDWPKSIEAYHRALLLAPTDAAAHEDVSFAFEQAGDLEKAIHHLYEALRLRPDRIEIPKRLIQLLRQTGETHESERLERELEQRSVNATGRGESRSLQESSNPG